VSDDLSNRGAAAPPPLGPAAPVRVSRPRSNGLAGWVIAAVAVLILAVAGGLLTAWVVANMRSVPGPIAAGSAAPSGATQSFSAASSTPSASGEASEAPRRTPTPLPTVEVTAEPFTYVVEPGDHLVNIADMFAVNIQDIMDLNGITNPNKIFVGEQLQIPGYGIQPTPKPTKKPK
jgi:LysM repeat protein